MVLDLDTPPKPTDIRLATVSGEVAIRLPHPADARVEANTAGGTVSNAFEDLRVGGQWGAKKITGTLGAGTGKLKATTRLGLDRPAAPPIRTGQSPHHRADREGALTCPPYSPTAASASTSSSCWTRRHDTVTR